MTPKTGLMVAKSSAFAITEINYVLIYTVFIFKKCIVFHNITVCTVLFKKCSLGEKCFSKSFFFLLQYNPNVFTNLQEERW